jgi:uncharacterized protein (DUF1778 family)
MNERRTLMLFKLKEIKSVTRLELRLAKAEKHILETECMLLSMDLTEYILRCTLSKPIRYWNTAEISLQLMKVVDQQRAIWALDKSSEDLQRLILNTVAIAFRDIPKKVLYRNPIDYRGMEGRKKSARIAIRLTEGDLDKIRNKAREANKTVSEYILLKALARPKSPEIIIDIKNELEEYQRMLSDLITNSLLKSPIYLTVQKDLLKYLREIVPELTKHCYINDGGKHKDM